MHTCERCLALFDDYSGNSTNNQITPCIWLLADTVDQLEQSIVTVDQSELSIESAKCEYTKCIVFSTYSYAYYVALSHLRIHKDTMLNGCSAMLTLANIEHRLHVCLEDGPELGLVETKA